MNFSRFLDIPHNDEPETPAISKEGQVARLREAWLRYVETQLPFRVGDWVTPRADAGVKGDGAPHVVIETRPGAEPCFEGAHAASCLFGARFNIRVLSIQDGDVVAHWGEAAWYEPYTGPFA